MNYCFFVGFFVAFVSFNCIDSFIWQSPLVVQRKLARNVGIESLYLDTPTSKRAVPHSIIPTPPSIPLPIHAKIVQGILPNGLHYKILPQKEGSDRIESYLEVLSGSVAEEDNQQGMAHLLEHVLFMGNDKRRLLRGAGIRCNAFTDFHHTVYFGSCPVEATQPLASSRVGADTHVIDGSHPSTSRITGGEQQIQHSPQLHLTDKQQVCKDGAGGVCRPLGSVSEVLDVLAEVLSSPASLANHKRLEKERNAVLSEASMNSLDHRFECQLLAALDTNAKISQRFPIGKINQIKSWSIKDIKEFYDQHYRPGNTVLYIVGDLSESETDRLQQLIAEKFGTYSFPRLGVGGSADRNGDSTSTANQSRKVLHEQSQSPVVLAVKSEDDINRSGASRAIASMGPQHQPQAGAKYSDGGAEQRITVLSTPSQHMSLHICAKRPIAAVRSREAFRDQLTSSMVTTALRRRLSARATKDPNIHITGLEVYQTDIAPENCTVIRCDVTAVNGKGWHPLVQAVVQVW